MQCSEGKSHLFWGVEAIYINGTNLTVRMESHLINFGIRQTPNFFSKRLEINKNLEKKLPILDMKVWVREVEVEVVGEVVIRPKLSYHYYYCQFGYSSLLGLPCLSLSNARP